VLRRFAGQQNPRLAEQPGLVFLEGGDEVFARGQHPVDDGGAQVAGVGFVAVDGGEHEAVAGGEHFVAPQLVHEVAQAVAQHGGVGAFRDDGHFLGAGHPRHAQPAGDRFGGPQLEQGVEAWPPGGEHQEPERGEDRCGDAGFDACVARFAPLLPQGEELVGVPEESG
jgi:hypothetical protein